MARNSYRKGINFGLGFRTSVFGDEAAINSTGFSVAEEVKSVTRNSSRSSEEDTVRGPEDPIDGESKGKTIASGGSATHELAGEATYKTGDPILEILHDAYHSNAEVAFVAVDAGVTTTGAKGWAGNGSFTELNITEPQTGLASVSFKLKPGAVFNPRYTVGGA